MIESELNFVTVYVMVLFRVAGMMIFAPLLGSARIPKRVKALMACVLAAAMVPSLSPTVHMPTSSWQLAVGLGGEIIFGLAMGMILSLVFIAAQWAGQMMGQQMGLNLGETFDPQFGSQGSVVSDLYYFMALLVFIGIGGHRAMIKGVHDSFAVLPLLSVGMNRSLLGMILGLFSSTTTLAMQLAAPLIVSMLVVDVVLGFIGKTVPQLNIMTAGISLRALVGMVVLIVGLSLSSMVIRDSMFRAMKQVYSGYVFGQ
jgi:flagellar biosynthesis protein FliR